MHTVVSDLVGRGNQVFLELQVIGAVFGLPLVKIRVGVSGESAVYLHLCDRDILVG